jgi:hypothetical protein
MIRLGKGFRIQPTSYHATGFRIQNPMTDIASLQRLTHPNTVLHHASNALALPAKHTDVG